MLKKFKKIFGPANVPDSNSRKKHSEYVDLAPTDKADPSGIYSEALFEATGNPDVFNIALTGPYGSGKSSIIRTFLKKYEKERFSNNNVLQISLAAFLPEVMPVLGEKRAVEIGSEKSKVSKQEIERSILQQMLYGADANSLPLSRFKRIRSPRMLWTQSLSLLTVIGGLACWYLIQKQGSIFDLSFYHSLGKTNWFNVFSIFLGVIFIWQILHQIYIKSLGISLKSISLKDIELKPEIAHEDSILNRHLDEIIYFFQSTNYDLVVIEDLDRFNNPDIFVTLREINSLINANAGVRRQIRFLYALRDNMFVNTDRTKFFEFIIPVIPIINSSNSIDMMIEQEKRLFLATLPDRQFVREVSRYLDDLRLIQNIYNEFAIYLKNLAVDKENILNLNKLLAILIYKNVLPSDFEKLHRGKGKLAKIFSMRDTLLARLEVRYKSQISILEQNIEQAEEQVPSSLEELRKIYAMTLISKLPEDFNYAYFDGTWNFPMHNLWKGEGFDELFNANEATFQSRQYAPQRVNLIDVQKEIDSEKSYQDRKREIQYKSAAYRKIVSNQISELREKIANVRLKKFNELIRTDEGSVEPLFEDFDENCDLIKFLVYEGFLDDSYYQYTSLFHSGRLSPNDNKFLIQIRAFNNPAPDFQVDNPKEVIAAMREDDFLSHFALNVIIVDCLLSNLGEQDHSAESDENEKYERNVERLLSFVSSNFDDCNTFFKAYYDSGKYISELLSRLMKSWSGFISTVLNHSDCITHVARILAYLPEHQLKLLNEKDEEIVDFIPKNLSKLLADGVDIDPKRLNLIPFEMQRLETISAHPSALGAITDAGQYRISIENIEFIFKNVLRSPYSDGLNLRHYSTVLNSGSDPLIAKVEDNFDVYLKHVLLKLESNTEEDVSAILKVLEHSGVQSEYLEAFVDMQSARVPSLDDVPSSLYKALFEKKKIEATWHNCLAFLNSESSFDGEVLTAFLQEEEVEAELSSTTIPEDDSTLPLREFLINNNELKEGVYRAYVRALPEPIDLFPDGVAPEKCLILIEEGKVSFSKAAFDQLGGYPEYQREFIEQNIDAYMGIMDQLSVDDDLREQLLSTDISDAHKLRIVGQMDLTQIEQFPARASIIGQLYYRSGADVGSLDGHVVQVLVMHIKPTENQIAFLNRCHKSLSKDQVKETLQVLPAPYSNIRPGRRPMIRKTKAHMELVEWLKKRKIISSVSDSFSGESIYVNNYRTER